MNCFLVTFAFIYSIILWSNNVESTPKKLKHLDKHWNEFKRTFNKSYQRRIMERLRRIAWEANKRKVERHNAAAENHGYTLRAHHLADHSHWLYKDKMLSLIHDIKQEPPEESILSLSFQDTDLPESFDWREKGFITLDYNQLNCGSCYAFSVVTAVEAQVFINNGSMERLSVQQVVDCSDNMGCYGGSLSRTLRYVKDKGLMRHDEYPYKAKQSLCDYNGLGELVKISSWTRLPTSEETLAQAVVNIGPIPVAINASPFTFQLYHKGVYDDPTCPSDKVNHAMLLIGYTKDSWILKNWWSEHWGDQGYLYLKRGKNRCGIANYAAFVKLKSLKTKSQH